jgi:hypothetical protein
MGGILVRIGLACYFPIMLKRVSSATEFIKGGKELLAEIQLNAWPRVNGLTVALSSSSSRATVPSPISLSASSDRVGFTIPTAAVGTVTPVTVKAVLGTSAARLDFSLLP